MTLMKPAGSLGLAVLILASLATTTPSSSLAGARALSSPADWPAWHLESNEQFRLAPPPRRTSDVTKRDLRRLIRAKDDRTSAVRRQVLRWNKGPAVLPWTKIELQLVKEFALRPPFVSRALRYVHTGMHDVLIAVKDSTRAHRDSARPVPVKLRPAIEPLIGPRKGRASVPVQSAFAGFAETVLPYFFPEAAGFIADRAKEAVQSRIYAGASYPSDVAAARHLGRTIGVLVIEEAKADGIAGTEPPWPRPVPGEERAIPSGGNPENQWQPAPPDFEPPFARPVGSWAPQLMTDSDQWLTDQVIPGPSTFGSPEFLEQTRTVLETSRNLTDSQRNQAHFWNDPPSATATPPGHWYEIAIDQLQQYPMSTNEATRAFALLGAVQGDAAIAAFGAKYYWWSIRPIHAIWRLCENDTVFYSEAAAAAAPDDVCPHYDNSTLSQDHPNYDPDDSGWYPLIETPSFPSYPGGHGTFSGSAGRILGYLFPAAEATMDRFGILASDSRLYGGIHFDEDNDDGVTLGRWIADLAIARGEAYFTP